MGFQDKINQDLKEAMKAKDEKALRAIRAVKAAILLANTDGTGQAMTDERGIQILQKLVKQRKESLEIYETQGREDLAAIERDEIQVLTRYLPEQMSEDKLREVILTLIQDLGATNSSDLGRVMGSATKQLAGQAEGKTISTIVKDLLSKS